jgi:hypothetical protein
MNPFGDNVHVDGGANTYPPFTHLGADIKKSTDSKSCIPERLLSDKTNRNHSLQKTKSVLQTSPSEIVNSRVDSKET